MAMSKGLRIAIAFFLGTVLCFALLLACLMATPQGRSFFQGAGRFGEVVSDPRQQAEIAQDIEKSLRTVTADSALSRANTYYRAGRYEKALEASITAGNSFSGAYGTDYGRPAAVKHYEALCLQAKCEAALQRTTKATQTYKIALILALEIKRARTSEFKSSERVIESYRNLADALSRGDEPSYAEENYRLALSMCDECQHDFGTSFSNSCSRASLRSVYGTFLMGKERYPEAENALRTSLKELRDLEASERGSGASREWLGRIAGTNLEMMGRLYEKQKRFTEAAECYENSLACFEKTDLMNSDQAIFLLTAGESAEALGDLISTGSGAAEDSQKDTENKGSRLSAETAERKHKAKAFRYYQMALHYYEKAKEFGSRGLDGKIRSVKSTIDSLE